MPTSGITSRAKRSVLARVSSRVFRTKLKMTALTPISASALMSAAISAASPVKMWRLPSSRVTRLVSSYQTAQ